MIHFYQDPIVEREVGSPRLNNRSCTRTLKIPKYVTCLTDLGGKQQGKDAKEE